MHGNGKNGRKGDAWMYGYMGTTRTAKTARNGCMDALRHRKRQKAETARGRIKGGMTNKKNSGSFNFPSFLLFKFCYLFQT